MCCLSFSACNAVASKILIVHVPHQTYADSINSTLSAQDEMTGVVGENHQYAENKMQKSLQY